ncbi:MarR family winged helix-turn-helix transcriptional regulator [Metabacillus niabensis]|uniref:MarR family winged helix-turn-helix transcriptional regulator n=1 Tax=Metabacillus niabensis TaxID=324854 RepID=UPI001CFB7F8B|nr:MarR family transcriptional regulator [Metabacillus niabensis]
MKTNETNQLISDWMSLANIQIRVEQELESILQEAHQLTLKEFYVLLFLSQAPNKKLKLQQLQNMVGLSQSAMSRLVSRFEAKGCGTLRRHVCVEDRRAIFTALTESGEKKLEEAIKTVHQTLQHSFADKEIQAELKRLLTQF